MKSIVSWFVIGHSFWPKCSRFVQGAQFPPIECTIPGQSSQVVSIQGSFLRQLDPSPSPQARAPPGRQQGLLIRAAKDIRAAQQIISTREDEQRNVRCNGKHAFSSVRSILQKPFPIRDRTDGLPWGRRKAGTRWPWSLGFASLRRCLEGTGAPGCEALNRCSVLAS